MFFKLDFVFWEIVLKNGILVTKNQKSVWHFIFYYNFYFSSQSFIPKNNNNNNKLLLLLLLLFV